MQNLLQALYFIILIVVGINIFPFWGVVLSVWIGVHFFVKWRKLDNLLTRKESIVFHLTAFGYPLIETLIKYAIEGNWIPYSWEWLNRLEHFGFSLFLGFLLLPLIKKELSKLSFFGQLILYVGLIVTIGNGNEFVEYLLRVYFELYSKFSLYYWDTILDLFVNLMGAAASFVCYKAITKNRKAS